MKFSYIDKKTPIHRLHPGCKIIWVLSMVFGTFLLNDPIFLLLLFIATLPFVIIGRIVKEWGSFIKLALFLSFFIVFINTIVSQHGSTILLTIDGLPIFGSINIFYESLVFSFSMCLRLLITLSAFAILSLTINPDDLLQSILLLKFPYRTVLVTTIATRFIPTLFKDLQTLQDSLKTRGYYIGNDRFFKRIKKQSIIIPPLLSNSLERSIQSAEAMEARGFGSKGKKTIYKAIKTTNMDYVFLVFPMFLCAVFIIFWIFGIGNFEYYPKLSTINFNISYILLILFLVIFTVFPAILSPMKKVIDLD